MEALRFACDAMLGRLARWLRFAGFDAIYDAQVPDRLLAALARSEGRWLLTRDRRLAAAAGPRVLLIRGATLAGQVAELRARLPLEADPKRYLSRCSSCNGVLDAAGRDDVRDRVPPFVAATAPHFLTCRACDKVYWPGSHVGRITAKLEALFGRKETC
ncbi:MAG: Mut7-C RNAse domain-containing protein [Acidobacteriota bacterium]